MFKENLRKVMSEKGITQAELSRVTGIGKPSISQYYSGKYVPSPKYLQLIADALGCTETDLIDKDCKEDVPQAVEERRLTIAEVARRCGKSKDFISGWLQDGNCPFGYARKGKNGKLDTLIPAARFEKWIAGEM